VNAEARLHALRKELWPADIAAGSLSVYAVLDAARDDRIFPAVTSSGAARECLFAGAQEALEKAAPHLVALSPEAPLLETIAREGWGQSWGIFLSTPRPLEDLRRELRRLLRVQLPDGKRVLFRFYDPRVLRTYFPTCTPAELRAFMDFAPFYFAESEKADALVRYHREPQGLGTRITPTA